MNAPIKNHFEVLDEDVSLTLLLQLDTLKILAKPALIDHCTALQDAVRRQDQTLHRVSAALASMNTLTHDLGAILYAMVDAHDEADQEAVTLQLIKLSERRKAFKTPGVH
jgi:hypothetical protein